MKVFGWNNGQWKRTGAGYGIRMSRSDRDKYFQRTWDSIFIELEGNEDVEVNLSNSFWQSCRELRSAQIGRWMIGKGLAAWTKGSPPVFELELIGNRKFILRELKA